MGVCGEDRDINEKGRRADRLAFPLSLTLERDASPWYGTYILCSVQAQLCHLLINHGLCELCFPTDDKYIKALIHFCPKAAPT